MPSYFLGKFTEYPEKNIGSPLISAKLNLIYKKHNKRPTLHFLGGDGVNQAVTKFTPFIAERGIQTYISQHPYY